MLHKYELPYMRKVWALDAYAKYLKNTQNTTQGEIANLCGLSSQDLSRARKLRHEAVDELFELFCLGLDLSYEWFVEGTLCTLNNIHLSHIKIVEFGEPEIYGKGKNSRRAKRAALVAQTKLDEKPNNAFTLPPLGILSPPPLPQPIVQIPTLTVDNDFVVNKNSAPFHDIPEVRTVLINMVAVLKAVTGTTALDNDPTVNEFMDKTLVSHATQAMTERLDLRRDRGGYGWWSNKTISVEVLEEELNKALRRDDMISVMNYAAMIWARENQ